MKNYFLAGLVILLTACSHSVRPPESPTSQAERYFEKSYTINVESSTYVGNPIIKVKDYYLLKAQSATMKPLAAFEVKYLNAVMPVSEKTDYPIKGYIDIDGVQHALVVITSAITPSGIGMALAVDSTGVPNGRLYVRNMIGEYQRQPPDPTFSGASPKFSRSVKTTVDTTKGYINHELLYNGTDGKSIFVSYKEFSPDDFARSAFFQNLTYEAKNESIRFKNYKIKVVSANSESIKFSVLEDGMGGK